MQWWIGPVQGQADYWSSRHFKKRQRAEPVEELSPSVQCSNEGAQAPHGAVPEVSFLNDISLVHSGQKIFVQFVAVEMRKSIPWKIDTGSEISFFSRVRIPAHIQLDSETASLTAATANGSEMYFSQKAQLSLRNGAFEGTHTFYICDIECRSIIGMDFLTRYQAKIDLQGFRLLVKGACLPLFRSTRFDRQHVYLTEEVQLAPGATSAAKCSAVSWGENPVFSLLFIPAVKRKTVELQAACLDEDGTTHIALTNLTDKTVVLSRGSRIAHVRAADSTNSIFSVERRLLPSDSDVSELYDKLRLGKRGLTLAQDRRVRTMLHDCFGAFSRNGEVGEARIPPIHVEFANSQPVRCKPYRHSASDERVIRELMDDMLKQNLIAKADGRYASPLCLIWQKGKPRAVVDYRAINKAVLPNQKGTIPPIQEQLLKVKPGSVFSVFDLTKAFMNFRITEETSQRLAFITSDTVYRPLRLPFGMVLSPSECVNAMKTILHGLDDGRSLIHYVDDLALVKGNMDELITATTALLMRLQEFNVKVNPNKSHMFVTSTRLLGHEVDAKGVSIPIDYVEKIRQAPRPTSPKGVQCFLGLVTWVGKFCPFLADIAKPLFTLAHVAPREFKWQESHQQAYDHLKWQLTNAPCLVHFDESRETELYTDSSNTAFSAVLVQVYDEDRKPVAYYSRCLKKNEVNWQIYLKEFGALVAAVKYFRPLLIGRHFKAYLDNHAVSYLHSIKLTQDSPKVARFVTYLNQFDFTVVRIKSAQNPSDFLSRTKCSSKECFICNTPRKFLPVPFRFAEEQEIRPISITDKTTQTDRRVKAAKDAVDESAIAECPQCKTQLRKRFSDESRNAQIDEVDILNFSEEQAKDEELAQLKEMFENGQLDTFKKEQIQYLSPRQRRLMIWAPQFRVVNNALGVVFNEHELSQVFKIIVPIQCYEQLVNYTHTVTLKHLGANKTIAYLKSNCILPGIDKIARLCISKCRECATQKAFTRNTRAPKLELYHNEPIGQFIFCDHAGPFPYKSGGIYSKLIKYNTYSENRFFSISQMGDTGSTRFLVPLHHRLS